MDLSGYGTGFIVTALNVGIRAYLKCLAEHQQNRRPLHRSKYWVGGEQIKEMIGSCLAEIEVSFHW